MMPVWAGFDQETLDREYRPSSCIEDINVYLDLYETTSRSAKEAAIRDERLEADLRFGDGAEETVDLFLPEDPTGAPLHIYIHGGYWQLLSKDESCFAATMFRNHGCCFAAVNYTLAPRQTLTGIVEENRRAIRFLYDNADRWGFDRERIYLSGSSAGAHLSMMMLLTDWREFGLPEDAVKGVCAVSGVYDLEPVRLSYVNDKVGMDAEEAAQNSPIRHAPRNRCPVIIAYGDNETAEFKRQSNEYRDLLLEADIAVEFAEIAGRNHFDVILDLADPDSWLSQRVLAQMGKKSGHS